MKNRYGDEYSFEKVSDNVYKFVGDLSYCRMGGMEGQESVDRTNLGFIDPAGGPFISPGYVIENKLVSRIYSDESGVFFETKE